MILADQNEPLEFDYYLGQTCEVNRGNWNQSPGSTEIYPDFTILAGGKSIGVNRKQVGEWLSDLDFWEEQMFRELGSPNIDYLYSIIEGFPSRDNSGIWAWNFQEPNIHLYKSGNGGTNTVSGFHSQWNYKAVMGKFIRIHAAGIPILFTDSILSSAVFIAELHSIAEREDWESKTFNRLIKKKYIISEPEKMRRDYALFLMNIPSVGEEAAMTLVNGFPSFYELYEYMITNKGSVAGFEMASGRKIGPAIDKKIRMFWGAYE